MNGEKSLKKNILMSIILTVSNFIFPLITYTYVARVLTPVGTGKIEFVNSVLSFFSYIAMLGVPAYGLRECAKIRDDRDKFSYMVQELLALNILSTSISYIFLFLLVLLLPRFSDYKMLFLIMSLSIFSNTIGLEWVYKAMEEYAYITIRSLLFKCVSVGLTFVLIHSQEDYLWYGFLSVFTVLASAICNFWNIRKFISFKKIKKYNLKPHMKPILTLFAASVVVTIYANFDVSMIGFIRTEEEVGLYGAALKIESILLAVSTSITSVMIPRMAYYLKNGNAGEAKNLIKKSIRVSMILAMPLAIYVFIFAENVILIICGVSYLGAVSTLRVLMVCIMPLIVTNLFGNQILIPSGNEKRYSQSVFVGLFINLGLNLLLIPSWGAYGAAFGTLITEIWNACWMSGGKAKAYRTMLLKEISYSIYLIALTGGCVSCMAISVFVDEFTVFWQLFLTALTYFGIFYFVLLILKEPMICGQMKKFADRAERFRQAVKCRHGK